MTNEHPRRQGRPPYMLIDPETNFAVLGTHPWVYCSDLEEIEDWLKSPAE
jgi:hypothetical protein